MQNAAEGPLLGLAFILATLAVAMTSGSQERQSISNYIAAALTPTIVDVGLHAFISDPENLIVVVPKLQQ